MTAIVPLEIKPPAAFLIEQKRFGRYRRAALYRYERIFFGCAAYIEVRSLLRKKCCFYGSANVAMTDFREIDSGNLLRKRGDRHQPPGREAKSRILW